MNLTFFSINSRVVLHVYGVEFYQEFTGRIHFVLRPTVFTWRTFFGERQKWITFRLFRLFPGFWLGALERPVFVFLSVRHTTVTLLPCPEFSGSADKFEFLSVFSAFYQIWYGTLERPIFVFLPVRHSTVTLL